MIDKERFVDTIAWFDSYESIPEEESILYELYSDTNYFDRAVYIKELLFFIHKDPEAVIDNY